MKLDKLQNVLTETQKAISEISVQGNPSELYAPINYIMHLGGKRLRPALVGIGGQTFGLSFEQIKPLAQAVEIFHNFTLVHDDIMDNAPLRRGQQTVHEKWNANLAILSGDVMMIKVYDFILKGNYTNLKEIIETMNTVAVEVCEGQQMDMNFENRNDVTIDEYIEMIRLKTSVLVGGALKLGAQAAKATESDQDKIYDFGESLGIAFQLMDDYLDAFGDPEKFGKKVGGDILANKKTFLSIEALKKDTSGEMKKWFASAENFEEKVDAVKNLYTDLQVDKACQELMQSYHNKALGALKGLNCSEESKQVLTGFAKWLMSRTH